MKYLLLLLKALIFLALFVFALGNRQLVPLHLLPDYSLTLPLVVIVLASFALGTLLGIVVMVPRWWRHRRLAKQAHQQAVKAEQTLADTQQAASAAMPAVAPDQNRHMTDPSIPISIPYQQ